MQREGFSSDTIRYKYFILLTLLANHVLNIHVSFAQHTKGEDHITLRLPHHAQLHV